MKMKSYKEKKRRPCATFRKKSPSEVKSILSEKGDCLLTVNVNDAKPTKKPVVNKPKLGQNIKSKDKAEKKVLITYDSEYECQSDEDILDSDNYNDCIIWESRFASGDFHSTWEEESEEDSEIMDYMFQQQYRQSKGEDVRGETFYRDDETGKMRKLHSDSISIELHGVDSGYDYEFGDSSVFRPIMTVKEKLMLGLIPCLESTKKKSIQQNSHSKVKALNSTCSHRREIMTPKTTRDRCKISVPGNHKGILEITQIKLVTENEDFDSTTNKLNRKYPKLKLNPKLNKADVLKNFSQNLKSKIPIQPFSSEDHEAAVIEAQQSFKQTLLKSLPNPNFELKKLNTHGNKEYNLRVTEKSSSSDSDIKIPVLPKPKNINLSLKVDGKSTIFLHPITPYQAKKKVLLNKFDWYKSVQKDEYKPPPLIINPMPRLNLEYDLNTFYSEGQENLETSLNEVKSTDFGAQTGRSYTIGKTPEQYSRESSRSPPVTSRSDMPFREYVLTNPDNRGFSCSSLNTRYQNSWKSCQGTYYSTKEGSKWNYHRKKLNRHSIIVSDCEAPQTKSCGDATYRKYYDNNSRRDSTRSSIHSITKELLNLQNLISNETKANDCSKGLDSSGVTFEDPIIMNSHPNTVKEIKVENIDSLLFIPISEDEPQVVDNENESYEKMFSTLYKRLHSVSSDSSFDQGGDVGEFSFKPEKVDTKLTANKSKFTPPYQFCDANKENYCNDSKSFQKCPSDSKSTEYSTSSCSSSIKSEPELSPNEEYDEFHSDFSNKRFFTFPLDDQGSEVAIQVTLPVHISSETYPPDCPYIACAILNTAHNLIKKQCTRKNNYEQWGEKNRQRGGVTKPMRCLVDIEELFTNCSDSECCSTVEYPPNVSCENGKASPTHSLSLVIGNYRIKNPKDSKSAIINNYCVDSTKVLTANPKKKSKKTTCGFHPGKAFWYALSCGCLTIRRQVKVRPLKNDSKTFKASKNISKKKKNKRH